MSGSRHPDNLHEYEHGHATEHVGRDGTKSRVARRLHPIHVEAGYHEQTWGPHATNDHRLLGVHTNTEGIGILVRYLDDGPTGPEFELNWQDGPTLTVLDEDTVIRYLALHGIREHEEQVALWDLHEHALVIESERHGRTALIAELRELQPDGWDEMVEEHERSLADLIR